MPIFQALRRRPWLLLLLIPVAMALGYAGHGKIMDDRLAQRDPWSVTADARLYNYGRKAGAGIFQAHCAGCHGQDGKGERNLGIPDLTTGHWLYGEGTLEDIEHTIRNGIRAPFAGTAKLASMPAFASANPYAAYKMQPLKPDDIWDVLAFLHGLRGETVDRQAAIRGVAIWRQKGQCFDCHGEDAKGDNAIGAPDLTGKVRLYGDGSARSEFETVAHGRAGMCPAWARKLSSVELREVALYVHSLSQRAVP